MRILRVLLVFLIAASAAAADKSSLIRLEIPELSLKLANGERASLPRVDVSTIRIQLPWHSDQITYGTALVRVNGEPANHIMESRDGEEGIVYVLFLTRIPGFALRPGNNTVELTVQDRQRHNYRAIFLLAATDVPPADFNRWVQLEVRNLARPTIKCCFGPTTSSESSLEFGGISRVSVKYGELVGGNLMVAVMPGGCRTPLPKFAFTGGRSEAASVEINDGDLQSCAGVAAAGTVVPTANPLTDAGAVDVTVENIDNPARSTLKSPHAYAVVVGAEHYRAPIPPVPYALNDAATMRRYLTGVLGVPDTQIKSLVDPTLTDLRIAMTWLRNQIKADTSGEATVYIYYAGHGVPELETKAPYLLPVDANPSYIADSGFPLASIPEMFKGLNARAVVMIDACFSGLASRGGEGAGLMGGKRPAFVEVKMPEAANVFVISAAAADQTSNALPKANHGLFTYYLLSGLGGKAAVGGQITVGGLFEYVKREVAATAMRMNQTQTPVLSVSMEQASAVRLVATPPKR